MQIKNLLPLAMGAAVSAQSLTEALAANNGSLSILTSLLSAQPQLVQSLGSARNITILAPNNAALAAFTNSSAGLAAAANPAAVAALLTYHVLNGTILSTAITNTTAFVPTLLSNATYANVTGGQVVGAKSNGSAVNVYSGLFGESHVVQANLNFTGGVIHIIDKVLTVPVSPGDTAAAAGLTALVGALNATKLLDTVNHAKDLTIFAPSNAAFGSIANLAGNLSTDTASSILKYHVVQGQVLYSSKITGNTTLKTLDGVDLRVSVINGSVYVNSAKVITPDVLVSNGVVHVIDGVLNPQNSTAAPNPSTTVPAFPGASSASNIPFTSGVTAATTITSRPTGSGAPGAGSGVGSTSSRAGAARALQTGAVGLGALFGGAMVLAL